MLRTAGRAKRRLRIGITAGDPAGIGPEIGLSAARWAATTATLDGTVEPVLVGPRLAWERAARKLRGTSKWIDAGLPIPSGTLPKLGAASAVGGAIALACIDRAIDAIRQGELDAIVTGPVAKTSLHLAGHAIPGQTEYFALKCPGSRVAMMLAGPSLRVVLTSTHLPLKDAIAQLTSTRIVDTAMIAHTSLSVWLGKRRPKLALAALNPHAGEGGLFGDEEQRILLPAVALARTRGVDLSGPFAADTLFWQARHGAYDAVIVLYHDQGLIPLKALHFDEGVNVTLGLPFVRTSPDHGTAYDLAGKGKAKDTSMRAAIACAAEFAAKS